MKKPVVINLTGAPGAGKSTGAAKLFYELKTLGINCELVSEFAKDKTWEHNMEALSNQVYVFGKQFYRISRCANQVDVIITDSPLLLSVIYNHDPILGETFNKMVRGKMTIYISHRMSASVFSDKILVLENGKVADFDTHDNLLKKKGRYQELFQIQAENYGD